MNTSPRLHGYVARAAMEPVAASPAPPVAPDDGEADLITLREVGSKLWRGRWIILIVTLVAIAIAVLAVSRMEPRYRAAARVMFFGAPTVNIIDLQDLLTDPEYNQDTLQNEIQILRSSTLIDRVASELQLRYDPEFNPLLLPPAPGLMERLRAALPVPARFAPRLDALLERTGLLPEPAPQDDPAEAALRERLSVIGTVLEGLSLRPVEGTRVIEIGFVSSTAQKSAAIVNTIADQYIVDQLEAKLATARSATRWLSERVEDLRLKVQTSEEAVEAMRAELSETSGQTLEITQQQLVALNGSLSAARSRTAQVEAQYQRLAGALDSSGDGGGDLAAITEFRANPLIPQYRAEIEALEDQLATISANHPARRQIEGDLAEARTRLDSEAGSVVAAIGIELEAARAQEASLQASVRALETRALGQSREQVDLRQLEREASASRLLYETMLNRLTVASEQVELQEANARILSPADPPLEPADERKRLIVALAATLGALLGTAIVFLLDHLNNTFRAPQQVESLTGLPVLALVPSLGKSRGRGEVVRRLHDKPNSSLAEAIRNLRTSILLSNVDAPPKVVMFTSSVPREGKSTTAMLTAMTSRQMGRSAIIVDCDLRRPSAARTLQAGGGQPGLLAVLEGTASFTEALHKDPETGLHALMSRPGETRASINAADVLASNRFRELIRTLCEHYDLVVLDTPPALVVADARILSSVADAVVYAIHWDTTPRGAVLEGLKELRSVKAPVVGLALTMVNEAKASKYSFDGYRYYRGRYQDYYTN
jgi:polysaccharide biosynthesis transport protein